ncbi:hypothetical protein BWQ96_01110 [Gracilariopsis chorda]|uniref:Uncharacterized protein n=1 Tax=Gracilariopsis chorda TaxID=448386 RepID=A0A2V3J3Y3_9FLOR|nr:hypothetical protein BWQ96_01110 [Gracilariopsis chorda]|eukprot:PXF49161.1 hypothetical protein BWQ96_01110 [Gracilariopsis chorda]
MSIEGMLKVFESFKRWKGAKIIGFALNLVALVNWNRNSGGLRYAISSPSDISWETMNLHYAYASLQQPKPSLEEELQGIIGRLFREYGNCVHIT